MEMNYIMLYQQLQSTVIGQNWVTWPIVQLLSVGQYCCPIWIFITSVLHVNVQHYFWNVNLQVHSEHDRFFEFSQFTGTRWHAYKLYKPRSDCTVRMNFFANRVTNAWNNLPTSVSFTSLPAFSKTVRSVDFRNFLKCNSCYINLKGSC